MEGPAAVSETESSQKLPLMSIGNVRPRDRHTDNRKTSAFGPVEKDNFS
jgi:hypothetical protein